MVESVSKISIGYGASTNIGGFELGASVLLSSGGFGGEITISSAPPGWIVKSLDSINSIVNLVDQKTIDLWKDMNGGMNASGFLNGNRVSLTEDFTIKSGGIETEAQLVTDYYVGFGLLGISASIDVDSNDISSVTFHLGPQLGLSWGVKATLSGELIDFDGNEKISNALPLVLDLDGDGIELVNLDESAVFFDIDGDGFLENTGWADGAAGDGILVIDLAADGTSGADGVIERADEIVMTLHAEGATGDLEALALAFDSNLDGVFDANDARFNEFRIWVDGDMDGEVDSGELDTLANHGVTSIDLDGVPFIDSTGSTGPKDNIIHNTAAYTKADGTTAQIGDIGFVYSTYGYQWDDAAEGGVRLNATNDNRVPLKRVGT